MSTISKERLEQLASGNAWVCVQDDEAAELARIALASLEAKSRKLFTCSGCGAEGLDEPLESKCHCNEDGAHWVESVIYTAPPAPVSVPEPIKRNDADGWWMYKGRRVGGGCAEWYNRALDDCRAAMLHGSDDSLTHEGKNHPEEKLAMVDHLGDANEKGNSPVIPDGWVACSERMPDKGQNVLISVNFDSPLIEPLICSARYTGSTFRRGDVTVKPGEGVEEVTHWMPLPAAPRQEVK